MKTPATKACSGVCWRRRRGCEGVEGGYLKTELLWLLLYRRRSAGRPVRNPLGRPFGHRGRTRASPSAALSSPRAPGQGARRRHRVRAAAAGSVGIVDAAVLVCASTACPRPARLASGVPCPSRVARAPSFVPASIGYTHRNGRQQSGISLYSPTRPFSGPGSQCLWLGKTVTQP